ncbi:MAG: TlpA disulfide reductase family protein [Rhodanobacter sp.]
MFTRQTWLILALAVIAAAFGAWLQHRSQLAHVPAGVTVANVGDLQPDPALQDLDGHPHRISDYRGRRVLLNFWASWCGPCLDEMPALAQAQAKFGEQGSIVIGIAMDDPAKARAFLAAHPVNYPILLGQLASPSTTLLFGDTAEVLPFSVLLDGDGRILAIQQGTLNATQLQAWLAPTSGH